MCVKKIHQFLSSIKKDAHKRKLVPFFLPHGVVSNSYSGYSAFFVMVRAGTAYWKIWRLVNNFFARIIRFTVQKFQLFWLIFCIVIFFIELWQILILWLAKMPNGGYRFLHWLPPDDGTRKYSFTKKSTEWVYLPSVKSCTRWLYREFIWHKGLPGLHNNSQTAAGYCR